MSRPSIVGISGEVDQPSDLRPWLVPRPISLRDGRLYEPSAVRLSDGWYELDLGDEVGPGPSLLEDFARLHAASDEVIERYANTWGLLGLCGHGLPIAHLEFAPVVAERGEEEPVGADCQVEVDGESLEWWRYWSARADALMRVAGELQLDRGASADAWRIVWTPPTYLRGIGWPYDPDHMESLRQGPQGGSWLTHRHWAPSDDPVRLAQEHHWLASQLSTWIALGGVSPGIQWDPEPRFSFRTRGLFGAVGFQMVLVILGHGLAQCANCGRAFKPSRRSTPSRRTWCPDEPCQRAAHASAQRAYRARRVTTRASSFAR